MGKMRWVLLGGLTALYLYGRKQQAATRQPSVGAIDEPVVTTTWSRMGQLPYIKLFRERLVQRLVQGYSDLRVLDIGCGTGELTMLLACQPGVDAVTGIDLSESSLAFARETSELRGIRNTNFLVMDGAAMQFEDAQFSLVVSTISLHHWEQPQQVLSEIHRVLAPGGRAIIIDLRRDASPWILGLAGITARALVSPALRATGEPIASFQASFTPTELVLQAVKAGWSNPQIIPGFFWQTLILRKNGE